MKNRNQLLGAGSLLTSTFIYGFFGVLAKLIGFDIPLFYTSAIRNVPALIILGSMLLIKRDWKKIEKKDFVWIFLRTLLGGASFIATYIAVFYLPIGLELFIYFAGGTIGGYIIGIYFFNERITYAKIISLFVALFGLIVIYWSNFTSVEISFVVLSFVSGLGSAVWNGFSKKVSHKYSITQLNFVDTVIFVIFMAIVSLIIQENWIVPQFSTLWLYILMFGLMFIPTGQLMIYGYKHLNVHLATLIMLTEILFGAILGLIFFREMLSLSTLLGGGLIILAIVLPEIKFGKNENEEKEQLTYPPEFVPPEAE
jgi:drug/metabolite transporter (DMT)-like permease